MPQFFIGLFLLVPACLIMAITEHLQRTKQNQDNRQEKFNYVVYLRKDR